jgi:hypothetical protein
MNEDGSLSRQEKGDGLEEKKDSLGNRLGRLEQKVDALPATFASMLLGMTTAAQKHLQDLLRSLKERDKE